MVEFEVEGMTCGHCVQAVTKAVQGVDPSAKVEVDLNARRVSVDTEAERPAVKAAIEEAGYAVAGAA